MGGKPITPTPEREGSVVQAIRSHRNNDIEKKTAGLNAIANGSSSSSSHRQNTLDTEHTALMKRFEQRRCEAERLAVELRLVEEDIGALETRRCCEDHLTDSEWDRLLYLRDVKSDSRARIERLNNENDEIRYLVSTGDILFRYYNMIENVDSVPPNGDEAVPTKSPNQGDEVAEILKVFRTRSKTSRVGGGKGVKARRPPKTVEDRVSLLEMYMENVDANYVRPLDYTTLDRVNRCPHCSSKNRVMMTHDGCVYCAECFTQEYVLVDHEKPSYKDPPKEIISYAYKRINHFKEWLNQIQGKETTEVPDEVYDSILLEIKKEKITNLANLTIEKVKSILKKLKLNRYYEHAPHIMYRLNGIPVPHMPPELEERLCHMFYQIQVPFLRHVPITRKNFLSYSYVLHKLMQLLEQDKYLPCFSLLKSRPKLYHQDITWKKICEDLNWEFYKSI